MQVLDGILVINTSINEDDICPCYKLQVEMPLRFQMLKIREYPFKLGVENSNFKMS